jgi:hypothetical protein
MSIYKQNFAPDPHRRSTMSEYWPTKLHDIQVAREVIAEFGGDQALLGIFEMETDLHGMIKKVRLSEWVQVLINYYREQYGDEMGDTIMKKIVTLCIIDTQTIH